MTKAGGRTGRRLLTEDHPDRAKHPRTRAVRSIRGQGDDLDRSRARLRPAASPAASSGTAGSPSGSRSGRRASSSARFPGFVQLVGAGADGAVFFAGSVFFTLAALLELREATLGSGRWAADPSWWSAAVQFAGTLLFNLSTFDAMQDGLSSRAGEPAGLGARPVRLGLLPRLGRCSPIASRPARGAPAATRPRVEDGGREPRGLRVLRDLGHRVLRRAVERLGPRPRGRELDHRPGRALLLHRRPDAAAPRHHAVPRLQGRPDHDGTPTDQAVAQRAARRARAASTATASCSSRRPTTSCPSTACAPSTPCG